MTRLSAPLLLALALVPVLTVGAATWVLHTGPEGPLASGVLASLAAASGVVALTFAIDAARVRQAFAYLRGGGGWFGGGEAERERLRDERQHELVARMRRQIEELSAIRDLALIANSDVRLEWILERSLEVLEGLLGATEITIYLVEGADEDLIAVAHLSHHKARVKKDRPLNVEPLEARRALVDRRTSVSQGKSAVRAATLLVADREVIGALEVRLGKTTDRDTRELSHALEGLAKHIALAIKKPTLYDRAVVDALTGLYTKRHFLEQVHQLMAQRARLGSPLSLLILDIDHFKRVNDVHGHVAGDLVLAEVARRVREGVRAYDQAYRYGGEEVIVVAPNTPLHEAVRLAERLRQSLRQRPIPAGEGKALEVTASFGVAEFDPETMELDPALLVEAADQHLYRAKRGGRDRVCSSLDDASSEGPAKAA